MEITKATTPRPCTIFTDLTNNITITFVHPRGNYFKANPALKREIITGRAGIWNLSLSVQLCAYSSDIEFNTT